MSQQAYNIVSEKTKYHLVTNNEQDGALVTTSDGNPDGNDSVLFFSNAVEGLQNVTITGPNGLYVALPKDAGENAKLIWSKDEFEWTVSAGPDSAYQFYPSNGDDLFWVDKFGIGKVVIVLAGKDIVPPENSWYLIRL